MRKEGQSSPQTLGHVLNLQNPKLPNLTRLGLLHTLPQPASEDTPQSAFGRMAEVSAGKDTTTGHWEMMGLVVKDPFRTYPDGFPRDVIAEYENTTSAGSSRGLSLERARESSNALRIAEISPSRRPGRQFSSAPQSPVSR